MTGAFVTQEDPSLLVNYFGLAFVLLGTFSAALVAYRCSDLLWAFRVIGVIIRDSRLYSREDIEAHPHAALDQFQSPQRDELEPLDGIDRHWTSDPARGSGLVCTVIQDISSLLIYFVLVVQLVL